jgi:hypothetical protein
LKDNVVRWQMFLAFMGTLFMVLGSQAISFLVGSAFSGVPVTLNGVGMGEVILFLFGMFLWLVAVLGDLPLIGENITPELAENSAP